MPLIVISWLLYHFIVWLNWAERAGDVRAGEFYVTAFSIPFPDGDLVDIAWGDVFIASIIVLAFLEVIRLANARRTIGTSFIILVALAAVSLAEFFYFPFAHTTFFIFLIITFFMSIIASFNVSLRIFRRHG